MFSHGRSLQNAACRYRDVSAVDVLSALQFCRSQSHNASIGCSMVLGEMIDLELGEGTTHGK